MNERKEKGEHRKENDSIVEYKVYCRVYKKGIPNNSMYIARYARPGGQYCDNPICIIRRFSLREKSV